MIKNIYFNLYDKNHIVILKIKKNLMKFIKNYYSQCCKTDIYVSDGGGFTCNKCKKHVYETIDKKYYLKTQKELKFKNLAK